MIDRHVYYDTYLDSTSHNGLFVSGGQQGHDAMPSPPGAAAVAPQMPPEKPDNIEDHRLDPLDLRIGKVHQVAKDVKLKENTLSISKLHFFFRWRSPQKYLRKPTPWCPEVAAVAAAVPLVTRRLPPAAQHPTRRTRHQRRRHQCLLPPPSTLLTAVLLLAPTRPAKWLMTELENWGGCGTCMAGLLDLLLPQILLTRGSYFSAHFHLPSELYLLPFLKRQAGVPTKSHSDTKYSRVWTVWL